MGVPAASALAGNHRGAPGMILAETATGFPEKRRRIPVAMLLSLLVPGLGQVYATRLRRGAWIFGLYTAGLVAFLATATMPPRTLGSLVVYGTPVLLVVALYVFNLFDAGVGAWRAGKAALTRYNRVAVYAVAILGFFFLHHGSAVVMRGLSAVSTYEVGRDSNLPTIARTEKLLAWRAYFRDHEPRRGDLAIFERAGPDGRPIYVMGRVIGLSGDRVRLTAGRVVLNGATLARRPAGPDQWTEILPGGRAYTVLDGGRVGPRDTTPEIEVPDGSYFLDGDNRDDKRHAGAHALGTVPRGNLRDLPVLVIRSPVLSRIGKLVQPR